MADAEDARAIALAFEGASEAPHFDRVAFRGSVIFATLAPDRLSLNLKLPPEEQDMRCATRPDAFAPVPNKWGAQCWTTATLAALDEADLRAALDGAWRHQLAKPRSARRSR